jgi:hypothetical protein
MISSLRTFEIGQPALAAAAASSTSALSAPRALTLVLSMLMIVSSYSEAGSTDWGSLGFAPTTNPVGRAHPGGISGMASPSHTRSYFGIHCIFRRSAPSGGTGKTGHRRLSIKEYLPGEFCSHLPSITFPACRIRDLQKAGNASSLSQATLADFMLDLVRDNRMPGRGRSA